MRGTLDFDQISTGEGNSALVVFPDGTTLLVDAGAVEDHQAGFVLDERAGDRTILGSFGSYEALP
jgi:hypothetical protein